MAEKLKEARRRMATVPDMGVDLAGEQASNAGAVVFTAVLLVVTFGVVLAV